jgi:hypothetical protein
MITSQSARREEPYPHRREPPRRLLRCTLDQPKGRAMQHWTCASCEHPLISGFAWKQGRNFYCSEFCAESEALGEAPRVPQLHVHEPALRAYGL